MQIKGYDMDIILEFGIKVFWFICLTPFTHDFWVSGYSSLFYALAAWILYNRWKNARLEQKKLEDIAEVNRLSREKAEKIEKKDKEAKERNDREDAFALRLMRDQIMIRLTSTLEMMHLSKDLWAIQQTLTNDLTAYRMMDVQVRINNSRIDAEAIAINFIYNTINNGQIKSNSLLKFVEKHKNDQFQKFDKDTNREWMDIAKELTNWEPSMEFRLHEVKAQIFNGFTPKL